MYTRANVNIEKLIKNFDDIYNKIVEESKNELEELRKKTKHKKMITAIIYILFFILLFYDALIAIVLYMPFMIIIFKKKKLESIHQQEYTKMYKEKVIKNFIQQYDDNLTYVQEEKIPENIYKNSGFEKTYDRYFSEDVINGTIDGHEILMGEVHTQVLEASTDSDGHTISGYETSFYGLFCEIPLSKIYNGEIKIYSDKGKLAKLFRDKQRIEIDSSEFEKYFDVYADDKIQATQILTSDLMEKMINSQKEHNIKLEIIIKKNRLYIRYHTGAIFEGNILKSSVDYNILKKVYDIINFIFDITRKFIKISEETKI